MDTRFDHINEALKAIEQREESLGRILGSSTGYYLFSTSSRKRFQRMLELRRALHTKHIHYLECENMIIDIM